MKKSKKVFLLSTLILALSAAVYLNWSVSTPTSKTLGESKFVNATNKVIATEDEAKQTSAQVSKLTKKQENLFSEAKINRDILQDEIIDKAKEILNLENATEKERSEAQNQVAAIIKNFTTQDSIETTLKAKAFTECLCYINENGCTITVPDKEFNDSKALIIKSTVKDMTNMGFDKITIITI